MNQRMLVIAAALVAGLASLAPAQAPNPNQKWGDLSGQFVFQGAVAVKPIVPDKDKDVCGKFPLVDESMVVNPKNQGLANVVVWLFLENDAKVDVHPDYKADAAAKIKVNNTGCRFEPHVTVVRVGQTLVVGNGDPIGHNTKIDTLDNPGVNPIIPAGGSFDIKFENQEKSVPATMSCSIHRWMTGRLVVKDTPYVAVSDKDGKFTLKNVPAGDWNFKVWHEANGYVKDINGAALKKGVWKVTVKEGANDEGKLVVKLQ